MVKPGSSKYIILIFWMLTSLFFSIPATADSIFLTNGQIIQGNIIEEEDSSVSIDVVIERKLIGALIEIHKNEIEHISINGQFKELLREGIDDEKRSINLNKLKERMKSNEDIDERILNRVQRIKKRNNEIDQKQESKRRFLRIQEQEKELLQIKHEQRIELIKESNKIGVKPEVSVIDVP